MELYGAVAFVFLTENTILRTTIKNQIYQNFVNNSLEIDRMLIEHPQFRKYIYGNETVNKDTLDLDLLMSMIELVNDVVENIYVYEKYIPKKTQNGMAEFRKGYGKISGIYVLHGYIRKVV